MRSEFDDKIKNRISYINDSHVEIAKQLATEQNQARKRWATLEKILDRGRESLFGMDGDVYGIVGQEILTLPALNDIQEEI